MNSYRERLIENVAAVSGEFHKDERYQKFYDEHGGELSGFPGIWKMMARAGEAFTRAEERLQNEYDLKERHVWDEHNWVDSIDEFVSTIFAKGLFTTREFEQVAKLSIQNN